MRGRPDR